MIRPALGIVGGAAVLIALVGSCVPSAPRPLDVNSYPSAKTSAEPLFITNMPEPAASSSADAGPVVAAPAPIPSALPDSVDVAFERTVSCAKGACAIPTLVPDKTDQGKPVLETASDLGVAPTAAVWSHKIASKAKVVFPRAEGLSLIGVVLKGSVSLVAAEGGAAKQLDPWGAFVASTAGVSLQAGAGEVSVVLVAVSTEGPLGPRVDALRKNPKPPGKRETAIAFEDLRSRPVLTWAGGAAHARLGFEADRSPKASLSVLQLGSDMPVAEHNHNDWELMVPLRAQGTFALGDSKKIRVEPGGAMLIPPGAKHHWAPEGKEPFLGLQYYLPAGAEQRFKALAAGKNP